MVSTAAKGYKFDQSWAHEQEQLNRRFKEVNDRIDREMAEYEKEHKKEAELARKEREIAESKRIPGVPYGWAPKYSTKQLKNGLTKMAEVYEKAGDFQRADELRMMADVDDEILSNPKTRYDYEAHLEYVMAMQPRDYLAEGRAKAGPALRRAEEIMNTRYPDMPRELKDKVMRYVEDKFRVIGPNSISDVESAIDFGIWLGIDEYSRAGKQEYEMGMAVLNRKVEELRQQFWKELTELGLRGVHPLEQERILAYAARRLAFNKSMQNEKAFKEAVEQYYAEAALAYQMSRYNR